MPWSGRPTVPTFWASREVGGQRGGGLGEAVALEHVDADAAVEVAEPLAERGAAGDGVRALAAERGTQLAVDQPVEDAVLGAEPQAGCPTLEAARPGDRHVGGPVEDLAPAVGDGALARRC